MIGALGFAFGIALLALDPLGSCVRRLFWPVAA